MPSPSAAPQANACCMSRPPWGKVLLQNKHRALLLTAWKALRSDVVILLQLGDSREEVKAG